MEDLKTNRPIIIGFSAKKQGGKTTAVNALMRAFTNKKISFQTHNFADHLKHRVAELFCPPTMFPFFGYILRDMETKKDEILPCGKTLRYVLQSFGTDYCRTLWPDVWVEAWKRNIFENCFTGSHSDPKVILVGDVRFPNELKAIQEMGGHVIRFTRAPFAEDQHVSETALDYVERETTDMLKGMPDSPTSDVVFDVIIDNKEMSISQQDDAVWALIEEKGWLK